MAHIGCPRVGNRLSAVLADVGEVLYAVSIEQGVSRIVIFAEFLPLDLSPQPDFEVVSLVVQAINPPL